MSFLSGFFILHLKERTPKKMGGEKCGAAMFQKGVWKFGSALECGLGDPVGV